MDHLFTIVLVVTLLICGGYAKSAIDRIEKNIQAEADEGLRNAKPAPEPAWYSDNCEEVSRTCRARVRLEKVKKT